eukprot:3874588-Lingulodinium_polyedra.AAC.1
MRLPYSLRSALDLGVVLFIPSTCSKCGFRLVVWDSASAFVACCWRCDQCFTRLDCEPCIALPDVEDDEHRRPQSGSSGSAERER